MVKGRRSAGRTKPSPEYQAPTESHLEVTMNVRPAKLPKRSAIFINYRRQDSAGHTGRLFDHLSTRFPGRVFMDIDTIQPGIDFVEAIEQALGCCEVLIVM